MQNSFVYLYPNKIDVYTLGSSWLQERYRRVYNRNLKIYRSTDNRIDIQVRSSDEKNKNVQGTVLVFNLISTETKDLILQKDCSADDEAIGRMYVTLTRSELEDLEQGFYEFSIVQETRSVIDASNHQVTSKVPLYFDDQYGAVSTIEVSGDVLGGFDSSLVVNSFSYTNPEALGEDEPKYYFSSIIDARPDIYTANSLHTFQFYFDNYDGTVTIQGSIDPSASPNAGPWSDITTVDPATESYKNIVGKWNWLRIKHIPSENNTGTLDKILYR